MLKNRINELQRATLSFMKDRNLKKGLETINLAIDLDDNIAINHYIKGRICQELIDFSGSIISYEKYLSLERYVDGNDTYRRAQHNLSICYFTIRNFKEGSRLYHFRHQPAFLDRFNKKRVWDENVDKGKVLIWAEQGIGDEILFMRFLKLLEKSDCQFFLECDPRIHRIVNINFPYIKLIDRGSEINWEYFDYHIPFGDLLSIFHEKLADVSHPYISISLDEKVEKIRQEFTGKQIVGISWRSLSPDYHLERSKKLEDMCQSLNQDEDILINLQPSVLDGELSKLEKLGFKVINCCDCKKDIDTVFQLITICSKVITVANSVAHFAGALGKKTILWLPEYPTWRWGQDMVASDLYPSIELKRS